MRESGRKIGREGDRRRGRERWTWGWREREGERKGGRVRREVGTDKDRRKRGERGKGEIW